MLKIPNTLAQIWAKQHLLILASLSKTTYHKKKRRKMKHRKTLIKEEGWLKTGDWWVGRPLSKEEREPLRETGAYWSDVLAHECRPGYYRAPISLNIYPRKRKGGLAIHGRCSGCSARLNEKVKQLITMMETL